MVKNPPKIKIIHLGDIENPEFSFLSLRHLKLKLQYPNGEESKEFPYDVIDRQKRDVAVICAYDLAEEKPRIWLRSCVRPGLTARFPFPCTEASTWELPAGLIDDGELPSEAGIRELQEEVGLKVSSVETLGTPLWGSVGILSELIWFFAVDVTGIPKGTPSEDGSPLEKYGECILVPLEDALGICDLKTDTGIYRLARKLKYVIESTSKY